MTDETRSGNGNDEQQAENGAPEAAPPADLAGMRVLVVEDEAPVANFLSDYLTSRGCQVLVAGDGEAGLERFHAEAPDMVVCDLLLPKRNGFRLVEDFRQSAPDMPVVVMTGIYRSDGYRKEVAHARAFLAKPLQPADLETLASLLSERRKAPGEAAAPAPSAAARPRARSAEPWIPCAVVPLPRMLQVLWQERKTGLLTLRVGERRTVFVLKEGRLQFVRSNDPEMRLDRTILQLGLVSKDALQRARQSLDETSEPHRLGEILVEQGSLTRDGLVRAVQAQLRRLIARAFEETGGETLFRSEESVPDEPITIDADLRSIIIGGSGAMRDASGGLLGHLPDDSCDLVVAGDPDDPELHLPQSVRSILAAMTGPTKPADFLAMCDLAGIHGRALLLALLCTGLVAPRTTTAEWAGHVPQAAARPRRLDADAFPPGTLLDLERERATGVLAVRWRARSAWLAIADGTLRAAGSDDARARLGERLLASGLIDASQLQEALQAQARTPGRPIGRVLVEQGAVTADQLLRAVRLQTLAIAREALSQPSWDEAAFTPGPVPDHGPPDLDLSTKELALDALRLLPENALAQAAGRLASERPTLDATLLAEGDLPLTEAELEAARALTSDSLSELRRLSEQADTAALRMLVASLLVSPQAQPVAPM